jgi:hypothetical protein
MNFFEFLFDLVFPPKTRIWLKRQAIDEWEEEGWFIWARNQKQTWRKLKRNLEQRLNQR